MNIYEATESARSARPDERRRYSRKAEIKLAALECDVKGP